MGSVSCRSRASRHNRKHKTPLCLAHPQIETFDFAAQPSINEALARELLRGEYIGKRENLLPVGNPGTGKTHLATALGLAACSQGKHVRFTTTTGLVMQLLEQRETRTLQRLHKQLERLDLIILDELGYVPFSKAGAELLFDVVSQAYEQTSQIVTTNLPFEQWTEVLDSERLTGALLDRLGTCCYRSPRSIDLEAIWSNCHTDRRRALPICLACAFDNRRISY